MNTKHYTNLPVSVYNSITEFAGNKCLLVKKTKVQGSRARNCHYNVADTVKVEGGKAINGWLLNRGSQFINNGVWLWTFHSVWEDANGDWYDITPDANNEREYSTFVPDAVRVVDMVEGINYNDCVYFSSESIFTLVTNAPVEQLVWTYSGLKHFAPISCSGKYRLIRAEFPHNYDCLKRDYGLEIVDGKLVNHTGSDMVDVRVAFDYSLNLR